MNEAGTVTLTTGGASNLLANDIDPEGDNLTAIVVTNPSYEFNTQPSVHLAIFMMVLRLQLTHLVTKLMMEMMMEIQ